MLGQLPAVVTGLAAGGKSGALPSSIAINQDQEHQKS